MCWAICAYRDRHKNNCSHDSIPTCKEKVSSCGMYNFNLHRIFESVNVVCDTLTFFNDSNLCELQFSWHQRSTWPAKWNLSTAVLSDASFCAVGVLLHLTGLQAYIFKWHASSYITKSAVVDMFTCTWVPSFTPSRSYVLHQLYVYTCRNGHA